MEESSVAKNVEMREQLMIPDVHTKEFQCPICEKYFSRKFTLDAHLLIHKGEKPHPCPFCGKCFRQKGTLMRHKALHSSKNLFHCSLCNRGFRQKNVFIHHLRHRHNVSVETLDRRKYRTELKDYQSIMDTLPSFVHADSTAIASSDKHFDAVLFESIKKPGDGSVEVLQEYYSAGSNCTNTRSNVLEKSCNSEGLEQRKNINFYANECDNLSLKVNSNGSGSTEEIINEVSSQDRKPVINSDFPERNMSVSSVYSPQAFSCSAFITDSNNLFSSQCSNVTSSNDTNEENLICIPCQHSFTSEAEFKCHVKTHVQSILQGDMNSKDHKTFHLQKPLDTGLQNQFKDDLTSSVNMLGAVSLINPKSFSNHAGILNSNLYKENSPIKLEILDSELETSISPTKNEFENIITSASISKLSESEMKCPVCKATFQGENSLRTHSKEHDSYSLLKFICVLLRNPHVNQNQVSSSSALSCKKSFPNVHTVKLCKNLKESSQKINSQLIKHIKKVIKSSKKTKPAFKTLMCEQCKKKFSSKLLLEYHRQLHLRSKGFFCKCCKRGFSSKQLLLSHTRTFHLKAFTCSRCARNFSYRKIFEMHKEKCKARSKFKTVNGRYIDFPVINIESLLDSEMEGIIGVIPVCNSSLSGRINVGIPVMSVSQVKSLYALQNKV